MVDKNTGEEKVIVKIRGITIDTETARIINFQRLEQLLSTYIANLEPITNENDVELGSPPCKKNKSEIVENISSVVETVKQQIRPDKTSVVTTKQQWKIYKIVNTKGLIDAETKVIYPFGYFK